MVLSNHYGKEIKESAQARDRVRKRSSDARGYQGDAISNRVEAQIREGAQGGAVARITEKDWEGLMR